MKAKILTGFISVCLLFSLSSPGYGIEGFETPPRGTHEGRDAPLWDKGPGHEAMRTPVIKKIQEGVFLVGDITVNKPKAFVSVKGEINMDEGLVEYFACGPRGKLHESVLKLNVDPYYLQIALLLIGLEPGDNPLEYQGDSRIPEGDPVEIWVAWINKDKNKVEHRAEDMLFNKGTNKPMKHTPWVFTGSQIVDGRFMAEIEQSIVATYHDPFAILDHTLPTGGDDTLYFVNTEVVAPKGTPVTFIIKALKEEIPQKAPPQGPGHDSKTGR